MYGYFVGVSFGQLLNYIRCHKKKLLNHIRCHSSVNIKHFPKPNTYSGSSWSDQQAHIIKLLGVFVNAETVPGVSKVFRNRSETGRNRLLNLASVSALSIATQKQFQKHEKQPKHTRSLSFSTIDVSYYLMTCSDCLLIIYCVISHENESRNMSETVLRKMWNTHAPVPLFQDGGISCYLQFR